MRAAAVPLVVVPIEALTSTLSRREREMRQPTHCVVTSVE
jgi:hypothetical protein